jgi:hypothetical protein
MKHITAETRSSLTVEIKTWFTVTIKKRQTKKAVEQRVNITVVRSVSVCVCVCVTFCRITVSKNGGQTSAISLSVIN